MYEEFGKTSYRWVYGATEKDLMKLAQWVYMKQAAYEAGATIVDTSFTDLYGVSCGYKRVASHNSYLAEYGYAAVDLFTCGNTWIRKAFSYLKKYLFQRAHVVEHLRGLRRNRYPGKLAS